MDDGRGEKTAEALEHGLDAQTVEAELAETVLLHDQGLDVLRRVESHVKEEEAQGELGHVAKVRVVGCQLHLLLIN